MIFSRFRCLINSFVRPQQSTSSRRGLLESCWGWKHLLVGLRGKKTHRQTVKAAKPKSTVCVVRAKSSPCTCRCQGSRSQSTTTNLCVFIWSAHLTPQRCISLRRQHFARTEPPCLRHTNRPPRAALRESTTFLATWGGSLFFSVVCWIPQRRLG